MKKFALLKIAFILCCLLLSSCSKFISSSANKHKTPAPTQLASAKEWRIQRLVTQSGRKILTPHWEEAWSVTTNKKQMMIVVPAAGVPIQNPNIQFSRFFFFTVNKKEVTNGNIVELIGHNFDLKKNLDLLLKNYDGDTIAGFNGSFLVYDINYNLIKSLTFKDGTLRNNMKTRIGTMSAEEFNQRMKQNAEKQESH